MPLPLGTRAEPAAALPFTLPKRPPSTTLEPDREGEPTRASTSSSAFGAHGSSLPFASLKAAARDRVAPLALVQFSGRWHVHGIDLAARARRTFLLSRIAGAVEETAQAFDPPEGDPAEEARDGLRAVLAGNRALLELQPDTDAAARLGSRGEAVDGGRVAVHYSDPALFADEVAAFGPEVLVVEPAELVAAVRDRLAVVAAAHGRTDG